MRKISSVYLAGPERWTANARELGERQRQICEAAGVEPLFWADWETLARDGSEVEARQIYASALAMIRKSDAVVANLTPWRGPSAHPGVAFEVGFASALKKPVFAFINLADEDDAEYRGRVERLQGASMHESGLWFDAEGAEIEDFGLPETVMLWAEARQVYCIVTPDPLADLTGLELCLEAMRAYAD